MDNPLRTKSWRICNFCSVVHFRRQTFCSDCRGVFAFITSILTAIISSWIGAVHRTHTLSSIIGRGRYTKFVTFVKLQKCSYCKSVSCKKSQAIFGTTFRIVFGAAGSSSPRWANSSATGLSGLTMVCNRCLVPSLTGKITSTDLMVDTTLRSCRQQCSSPLFFIYIPSERHLANARKHTRMRASTQSVFWWKTGSRCRSLLRSERLLRLW